MVMTCESKYYKAGGVWAAMQEAETVSFLLSDHPSAALRASLGSTAVTANGSGTRTGELGYKQTMGRVSGHGLWNRPRQLAHYRPAGRCYDRAVLLRRSLLRLS
jgi:hypothetical protein